MRKSTKGKQSKSVALVLAVLMTMIFGMQMAGIAVEESCAATDGTYDLPGEFMVNGDAYTDVRPIELLNVMILNSQKALIFRILRIR